jgi:hypothetical protein
MEAMLSHKLKAIAKYIPTEFTMQRTPQTSPHHPRKASNNDQMKWVYDDHYKGTIFPSLGRTKMRML